MSKRIALVTGGMGGLGETISTKMADAGYQVVVTYSPSNKTSAEWLSQMKSKGYTFHAYPCDVGDFESSKACVAKIVAEVGQVDILVNNAGITKDHTILNMTDEEWTRVLDVNLSGAFYLSRAALAHMLERGTGRIVNISSVIGQTGNIGQANYAASKAGLFGLTMTLAREAAFALMRSDRLDPHGPVITVNAVAPGYIETEMIEAVPEKVLERIRGMVPLHRFGRPEEVARIVRFLVADESAYVTGQVWAVNGGMDM